MTEFDLDRIVDAAVPGLLSFGDPALDYFSSRDLLGENSGKLESLWKTPEVQKLIDKQEPEGYWSYPSRRRSGQTIKIPLFQTGQVR